MRFVVASKFVGERQTARAPFFGVAVSDGLAVEQAIRDDNAVDALEPLTPGEDLADALAREISTPRCCEMIAASPLKLNRELLAFFVGRAGRHEGPRECAPPPPRGSKSVGLLQFRELRRKRAGFRPRGRDARAGLQAWTPGS